MKIPILPSEPLPEGALISAQTWLESQGSQRRASSSQQNARVAQSAESRRRPRVDETKAIPLARGPAAAGKLQRTGSPRMILEIVMLFALVVVVPALVAQVISFGNGDE